jgi:hypothetical protein
MKKTLDIRDDLWEQLSQYLGENPTENVSSVVQGALKAPLPQKFFKKMNE